MIRTALTALLSHWRRHPFQLLTLILGLALATALWSGVQAINAEARASYDDAAEAVGGTLSEIVRTDGAALSVAEFVALRRAGWQVTPLIDGWLDTGSGRVRLLGIEPLTALPALPAAGAALGGDPGAFLTEGEILAAPATAERLRGAGIAASDAEGLAPGLAFADIARAAALLDTGPGLSRLLILPEQPKSRPALAEIAPDFEIRPPSEGADLARLTDSFHLNLTAFGLLSFAVGLFIVHGAIGLAFEQRRPMLRTLRALGLPVATLILVLLVELLLIALVAGALGIALGYLIAAALLPDVAATLRGLYGATVEGTLTLRPIWWAAGIGIAVAGTALAASSSLIKTARLPVLAPARPRAWAQASERLIWVQIGVALGLVLTAVMAATFGSGLIAGFTMLGALLLASAIALPPLLALSLAGLSRTARTPLAEWFWADTRQQLPGLSLALMALLLALAANIGVGTMVESFRLTFTGYLDQRLSSEVYVTAADEAQADRLTEWLDGRVDAVLPIWNVDGDVAGHPTEIFGVADHPTYRDNWPILNGLPDVWDQVAAGDGVLLNEQLARRAGLTPGDVVEVPRAGDMTVAGVYSDYGNARTQILIGLDRLTALYPEVERLRYGLRLPPDEAPALMDALVNDFGLGEENMIDQGALKAFSIDVFDRTFTVTGALNVLTLAVAGFAILTSLLTLATMRLPQLAPVWALGLTRARLARLELLRALILAALTVLAAIPVGLILAWVLLAVINVEAFGWRLPMFLFPRDWAILGALALLAAALASLWPALRLARIPPARLLSVFAHER